MIIENGLMRHKFHCNLASLICTGARLGDALVVDVALVADPGAALDDHVGGDHLVHGGVVRQGQLDDGVPRLAGGHLSKNLRRSSNSTLISSLNKLDL